MKLDPSAFVADRELITALEGRSVEVSCAGNCVLFRQGETPVGLYIVGSGDVTLTMNSPAGNEFLSMQAVPGSLLGLPGLLGNEPYTLTAACCGAQLRFITRDDLTDVMQSNPLVSLKILQILAAEVRSARLALADL